MRTKNRKRMRMVMTRRSQMKKKTTTTRIRMKTIAMKRRKTKIPMKTKMSKTSKTSKMSNLKIKTRPMMMRKIHNQWLTALRHSMTSTIFSYVHTIKRELSTSTLIHLN